MSRRSRRQRAGLAPVPPPQILDAETGAPLAQASFSGFAAANLSRNRGFVYFPQLDTRRELDTYSRIEILRRARWLYANVGFAKRICRGIANLVGSLTPVPLTKDKEWNQLALRAFDNYAGSAVAFDVGNKFDFYRGQVMLTRRRLVDGDHLAVLASSDTTNRARCMFYGGHQVRNALRGDIDQSQWNDGVRFNAPNAPLAYRVCSPNADDARLESHLDVSAQDAVLHCDYEDGGRLRGESALAHAIPNLLDGTEMLSWLKQGVKSANRIGYYLARAAANQAVTPGVGGAFIRPPGPGRTGKIAVERAFAGGGEVLELDPGEEVKMLLDQRPHPNQMALLDHLARDISYGTGFSPEVLWNIAKLGGATVRFSLADAQITVESMQYLLAEQFCSRYWVFWAAKEMNGGFLRRCQDPEWWMHGWQAQAKLTVDITRDGKLGIDLHQSGLITLKRWQAAQGLNWQIEMDQYLDERLYIKDGVTRRGLTMSEAFPPRAGTANVTERENVTASPDSTDAEAETGA